MSRQTEFEKLATPSNDYRLPPSDIAAEQAVIGSLLIDGQSIGRISGVLAPEHFFREAHAKCYEAALVLSGHATDIDQVSLANQLERTGNLTDIGGSAYLSHLVSIVPTSVHIAHYAELVRTAATQRDAIRAARDIENAALDRELPGALASWMIAAGLEVGRQSEDSAYLRATRDFADEHFNEMSALFDLGISGIGKNTGIPSLDRVTGGLVPGRLYVVAARTSVGKSQFCVSIAMNVENAGGTVCYFSLEEGPEEILSRMIAVDMGVDWLRLPRGSKETYRSAFMDAYDREGNSRIFLPRVPRATTDEMYAQIRLMKTTSPVDLVVVDYVGLIDEPIGSRNEQRVTIVDRIMRRLKMLARELNVPLMVAAQVNREADRNLGKPPGMSNLRESGGIEQTADVVLILHRPSYYVDSGELTFSHFNSVGGPFSDYTDRELETLTRIYIAKHRSGMTGKIDVYYDPASGKIGELRRTD